MVAQRHRSRHLLAELDHPTPIGDAHVQLHDAAEGVHGAGGRVAVHRVGRLVHVDLLQTHGADVVAAVVRIVAVVVVVVDVRCRLLRHLALLGRDLGKLGRPGRCHGNRGCWRLAQVVLSGEQASAANGAELAGPVLAVQKNFILEKKNFFVKKKFQLKISRFIIIYNLLFNKPN